MGSPGSWNPNNSTSITRARNYVVMSEPRKKKFNVVSMHSSAIQFFYTNG